MSTRLEKKFQKLVRTAQDIFFDEDLPSEIREVSELSAYNLQFDSDIEKKSFIIALLAASLEELCEPQEKGIIHGNIRLI